MSSVAMEASWSSSAASSTAMAAGAGAGVGDDDMAALLGRREGRDVEGKKPRLEGLDLRKGLMGIPPRLATQYGVVSGPLGFL
jgi:hypothetical protein